MVAESGLELSGRHVWAIPTAKQPTIVVEPGVLRVMEQARVGRVLLLVRCSGRGHGAGPFFIFGVSTI